MSGLSQLLKQRTLSGGNTNTSSTNSATTTPSQSATSLLSSNTTTAAASGSNNTSPFSISSPFSNTSTLSTHKTTPVQGFTTGVSLLSQSIHSSNATSSTTPIQTSSQATTTSPQLSLNVNTSSPPSSGTTQSLLSSLLSPSSRPISISAKKSPMKKTQKISSSLPPNFFMPPKAPTIRSAQPKCEPPQLSLPESPPIQTNLTKLVPKEKHNPNKSSNHIQPSSSYSSSRAPKSNFAFSLPKNMNINLFDDHKNNFNQNNNLNNPNFSKIEEDDEEDEQQSNLTSTDDEESSGLDTDSDSDNQNDDDDDDNLAPTTTSSQQIKQQQQQQTSPTHNESQPRARRLSDFSASSLTNSYSDSLLGKSPTIFSLLSNKNSVDNNQSSSSFLLNKLSPTHHQQSRVQQPSSRADYRNEIKRDDSYNQQSQTQVSNQKSSSMNRPTTDEDIDDLQFSISLNDHHDSVFQQHDDDTDFY